MVAIILPNMYTWTLGINGLTPWSGLVPLTFFLMFLLNFWMTMLVGAARKKTGITYPTMYAVAGQPKDHGLGKAAGAGAPEATGGIITAEEAYHFNCVQRAHQNTLETLPLVIGMMLVSWGFPIVSGFAGIAWCIGRVLYVIGYSAAPEKRTVGFVIQLLAQLCLAGITLASAIQYFRQVDAYGAP